jgi:mannose/fructose/N-acetylgalactosamine-specific phosphotransferase system component IIC
MLKKDSLPVFVIGLVLTLAITVPALYYLLSAALMDIVIISAFVAFLWLNALRISRHHKNSATGFVAS